MFLLPVGIPVSHSSASLLQAFLLPDRNSPLSAVGGVGGLEAKIKIREPRLWAAMGSPPGLPGFSNDPPPHLN